jgi:hypothetical protein
MSDQTIREALNRHWAASDAGDFDTEHSIYHENASALRLLTSASAASQGSPRVGGRRDGRRWVAPGAAPA